MFNARANEDIAGDAVARGQLRAGKLARGHYENFSIASFFISKRVRQDLFNIYAFSRLADDIADFTDDESKAERTLDSWDKRLNEAVFSTAEDPIFAALGDTIRRNKLSLENFHKLLKAFRLDLSRKRWETWNDLHNYTRYSADPVGRIVLELFGYRDSDIFALSDKICTALQLANHWQDVSEDWNRGRLYIPQEDLKKYEVREEEIQCCSNSDRFKKLMTFEVDRARSLLLEGLPLLKKVNRSVAMQLALYWSGGRQALEKIVSIDYDVLNNYTKLNSKDRMKIVFIAISKWVRSSV